MNLGLPANRALLVTLTTLSIISRIVLAFSLSNTDTVVATTKSVDDFEIQNITVSGIASIPPTDSTPFITKDGSLATTFTTPNVVQSIFPASTETPFALPGFRSNNFNQSSGKVESREIITETLSTTDSPLELTKADYMSNVTSIAGSSSPDQVISESVSSATPPTFLSTSMPSVQATSVGVEPNVVINDTVTTTTLTAAPATTTESTDGAPIESSASTSLLSASTSTNAPSAASPSASSSPVAPNISVTHSQKLIFTLMAGKFWRFNLATSLNHTSNERLKLYWSTSSSSAIDPVEDNDWIQYNQTTLLLFAWPSITQQKIGTYDLFLLSASTDLEEAVESNITIEPVARITVILRPFVHNSHEIVSFNHRISLESIPRTQALFPRFLSQLINTFERVVELTNPQLALSTTSKISSTPNVDTSQAKGINVRLADIILHEWSSTPGGSSFTIQWSNHSLSLANVSNTFICPIEQIQTIVNKLSDRRKSARVDSNRKQILPISEPVRDALFSSLVDTDGYALRVDLREPCNPTQPVRGPIASFRSIDSPRIQADATNNSDSLNAHPGITQSDGGQPIQDLYNISTTTEKISTTSMEPSRAPSGINVVISVNNKTVAENAGRNVEPTFGISAPSSVVPPMQNNQSSSATPSSRWDIQKVSDYIIAQWKETIRFIDENLVGVSIVLCVVLLSAIFIACLVLCIRKRNTKKTFEPRNRFEFRYGSERRAFLKKSTKPVILEADVRSLSVGGGTPMHNVHNFTDGRRTNDLSEQSTPLRHMKMVRINGQDVRNSEN